MRENYFRVMEMFPEYFQNDFENGIKIYTDESSINRVEMTLEKEIGVMYQDEYIILLRDAVIFPNGNEGCYIRVLPAKKESPVVVLPVVNGKILLMSHFRHSIRKAVWEIPRGFGEKGLSAIANAYKELEEETGYVDAEMDFLGWVNPDTGVMASKVAVYLARISEDVQAENKDEEEAILSYSYVDLRDIGEMIRNGEIEDGFTLSAIALALLSGKLNK